MGTHEMETSMLRTPCYTLCATIPEGKPHHQRGKMSKLIQRIERLGKDTPAPLGFGAATRRKATPSMVLLACVSNLKSIKELEGVFLDGVLFPIGYSSVSDMAKASSILKDVQNAA